MRVSPARVAALEIIRAIRRGELADHAFEQQALALGDADRRLVHEIVYGVLRLRGRIDHLLSPLLRGPLDKLDADVLDILRVGAYQLLELDRVPAYAAVSEAVELAKQAAGRGGGSLVNAVLRRLAKTPGNSYQFPHVEDDPVGYLTSWGSHPRWLVERWLRRWPAADVVRLTEYNNQRPGVYVSVIGSLEDATRQLQEAGIKAEPVALAPSSLRVEAGALGSLLAQISGVVQDPAAAAVVDYMAALPGERILDMCAAPGGKASLAASRGHEVIALELVRGRLPRLLENKRRLMLERLYPVLADATRPPVAAAEVVLLDAPCTGTGTLARHPDGRWRLGTADLARQVDLQRQLLDAAAAIVVPGGVLVYATCSLETEENEQQVEGFLRRHREFGLEPPPEGAVPVELLSQKGELVVLPQFHQRDGAYAARLRRAA